MLYVLHLLLLGIVALPGQSGWYHTAPFWLVLVQVGVLLGVLTLIAWQMERRGIVVSL
jgi:hypothetical protein